MTWVKLDDKMADHPKIVGLSDRAFRAHISALCYANRHLTDGVIPSTFLRVRVAEELVTAGVWARFGDAYRIHDFLDYQPSKAHIDEVKAKRIEAGRAGGHAKANAQQSASKMPSKIEAKVCPVPVNQRDLIDQEDSTDGSAAPRHILMLLEAMGETERSQVHLELCAFQARGASEADFRHAATALRRKRPASPRGYVRTILDNRIAERSSA